jgi:hypothetical protein
MTLSNLRCLECFHKIDLCLTTACKVRFMRPSCCLCVSVSMFTFSLFGIAFKKLCPYVIPLKANHKF